MSTKVWTRRQAERRKQERHAEAVALEQRRELRRRRLIGAAAGVAGVGVFVAMGVKSAHSHSPGVVALSAVAGLVVVALVAAHRTLRLRVGGVTAVLLMSLLGGALFLTMAALSPQCPDSSAVGKCTGGELANWGVVGMLLPLSGAAMLGIPVLLARNGFRVTRALVRLWKGQPVTALFARKPAVSPTPRPAHKAAKPPTAANRTD